MIFQKMPVARAKMPVTHKMLSARAVSAVLTFFFLTSLLASCDVREAARTENVLGTLCTVNAFDDGTKKLYDGAFTLLRKIDSEFNVNDKTSFVSRVNEAAGLSPVAVSGSVFFVIKKALSYAEKSGGDFDPAIGPLVRLWGIGTENQKVPTKKEISEALPLVNWKNVILNEDEKTVYLAQKGMSLDLGGIAKGYAADVLAEYLSEKKVKRAVINLGGNVYALGSKPDGSKWRVGIKNPFENETEPCAVVEFEKNMSVVTSGSYERFMKVNGKTYHHILNPHTGYPAEGSVLGATIVNASSCDADALSTIAFIQGEKRFSEWSVDSVFIKKDGTVSVSKNLMPSVSVQKGRKVSSF